MQTLGNLQYLRESRHGTSYLCKYQTQDTLPSVIKALPPGLHIPQIRRMAIHELQLNASSSGDLFLLVHTGWSAQTSRFPRICWVCLYIKKLLVSTLVSLLTGILLEGDLEKYLEAGQYA